MPDSDSIDAILQSGRRESSTVLHHQQRRRYHSSSPNRKFKTAAVACSTPPATTTTSSTTLRSCSSSSPSRPRIFSFNSNSNMGNCSDKANSSLKPNKKNKTEEDSATQSFSTVTSDQEDEEEEEEEEEEFFERHCSFASGTSHTTTESNDDMRAPPPIPPPPSRTPSRRPSNGDSAPPFLNATIIEMDDAIEVQRVSSSSSYPQKTTLTKQRSLSPTKRSPITSSPKRSPTRRRQQQQQLQQPPEPRTSPSPIRRKRSSPAKTRSSTPATPGPSCLKQLHSSLNASSKKRNVHFDLQQTEYHDNDRSLSSFDEWKACWFSPEDLKSFKLQQAETVKTMFSARPAAADTEDDEEDASVAESVSTSASSIPNKKKKKKLRQKIVNILRLNSFAKNDRSSSPSKRSKRHQQQQELEELDWRTSMELIYQECRKLNRRNQLVGHVNRAQFQNLYEKHGELVGLEVYILFALRGSVSSQVRQILQYYRESLLPPDEEDADPRYQQDPDQPIAEFVQKCHLYTLPVRFFVHELALAQSAALRAQPE
ncbi:hypothetical protein ACA910_008299 [Epithemia clementina (nom. ined.)]